MGKYSDMLAQQPAQDQPAGKYSRMLMESQTVPDAAKGALGDFGENFMAGLGQTALGVKQKLFDTPAQAIGRAFPVLDEIGQKIGLPTAQQGAQQTQDLINQGKPFNNRLIWHSLGGFAGNLTGNALEAYAVGRALSGIPGAPSAGAKIAAAAPKAAKYGQAAVVGAGVGALQPTADDESTVSNVLGGAIGGVVGQGAANLIGAGVRAAKRVLTAADNINAARAAVDKVLQSIGTSRAANPEAATALESEVKKALDVGGALDEAALRRKADYLAVGAQPRLGRLVFDTNPQQGAFEHTLVGLNGVGKKLSDVEAANNRLFTQKLNDMGAAASNLTFDKGGDYAAGQAVHKPLQEMVDAARAHVGGLYDAAEAMNGRPIQMDHVAFTQLAGDLVDKSGKNYFLPQEFKNILNDVATGKYPLTVGTAEQIKSALATAARTTKDGNVKTALGAVRDALEQTPILGEKAATAQPGALSIPGTVTPGSQSLGADTINAFRAARAANAQFRQLTESNPAIKDVFNGIEPDKFFQKHVVGGKAADLQQTADFLKQSPEAFQQVRNDILGYLKSKALNGASDEVGKFSQSGFNKAMSQFGKDKLAAFFSPDEIANLQRIGRVASYEQVQPPGSRYNNSGTAAQGANLLMKYAGNAASVARSAVNALAAHANVNKALNAQVPVIAPPPTANQNMLLQYLGAGLGASAQRGQ